MTSPALRARYLNDSILTASPARLLIMLYERLLLDLAQGETAIRAAQRETASEKIQHAQEIVLELRTTLDESMWEGAAGLAQTYGFMLNELIAANVNLDADKVVSCRVLVEPLLDAWRQAALATAADAAPRGA
jgi:flagellar protein FliS